MIYEQKVVVVMPAYNAARTLEATYSEIPRPLVDEVILVDDASADDTAELARKLGIEHVIRHDNNLGYGGNQKTCYEKALSIDADIIIMLHPDYQYTPKLIASMAHLIASGLYPVVMGSRILGKGALQGGMPMIKYVANRFLTLFQNILLNEKLSEYHSGYRAFSAEIFERIDITQNSDDFLFDNQMICQIFKAGFEIGEITCPTKYFPEASSINMMRSTVYALGVMKSSIDFRLESMGLMRPRIYRNLTPLS
jgi:glycosyltransferase involved in cell wall biosynthesis